MKESFKSICEGFLHLAMVALVIVVIHLDEWTAIAHEVVAALKSTAY